MNPQHLTTSSETQNANYISDFPLGTSEDDILKFFKDFHVTQVKLFKKLDKIFAHVYFENPDYAEKCRKTLNGENFTSNEGNTRPIRICKFEPRGEVKDNDIKKNLLVKNVDRSLSSKEFYKMFEEFGEIKSSKLEIDQHGESKGYGYVYFTEEQAADKAKNRMNGKQVKGSKLEIVNLIPSRSRDSTRNNLYIKNLPFEIKEEDIKKIFQKYGPITSAIISRDDKGNSKGFGFVCFTNPLNAATALKDMKEKNFTFPGCNPLYLNYAMKKEERDHISRGNPQYCNPKIIAKLIMNDPNIKNEVDFENELRLFIKVIFLGEYNPKEIKVNFINKSAEVRLNSLKDLDEFFKKYTEQLYYNYPKFVVSQSVDSQMQTFQSPSQGILSYGVPQQTAQYGMNAMTNQFGNMNINQVPFIPADPNKHGNLGQRMPMQPFPGAMQGVQNMSNQFNSRQQQAPLHNVAVNQPQEQFKVESELIDDLASEIYEIIDQQYPNYSAKLTGMIVDLGYYEMKRLFENREALQKVIQDAYDMLPKGH